VRLGGGHLGVEGFERTIVVFDVNDDGEGTGRPELRLAAVST
jgi:hypothetical protein